MSRLPKELPKETEALLQELGGVLGAWMMALTPEQRELIYDANVNLRIERMAQPLASCELASKPFVMVHDGQKKQKPS